MSFRRKLSLFFVAMVALPVALLAVLVVQVSEDSRDGKTDARVAAGLATARALYDEALAAAPAEAERIARRAGPSLQADDRAALQRIAAQEVAGPGVASVVIGGGGEPLAVAGPERGFAGSEAQVRGNGGERLGFVRVATLEPGELLDRVRELTGLEAALAADAGRAADRTPSAQPAGTGRADAGGGAADRRGQVRRAGAGPR